MTLPSCPTWAPDRAPAVLLVDGIRSVPLWVAETREARNTGLLGTGSLDGALWITKCAAVHTFGMRYPLDVVFVAKNGQVVSVITMRERRLSLPRLSASSVVELRAGLAQELSINRGTSLQISSFE